MDNSDVDSSSDSECNPSSSRHNLSQILRSTFRLRNFHPATDRTLSPKESYPPPKSLEAFQFSDVYDILPLPQISRQYRELNDILPSNCSMYKIHAKYSDVVIPRLKHYQLHLLEVKNSLKIAVEEGVDIPRIERLMHRKQVLKHKIQELQAVQEQIQRLLRSVDDLPAEMSQHCLAWIEYVCKHTQDYTDPHQLFDDDIFL